VLPISAKAQIACNGSQGLCNKRFNEVRFLTTHNAFNYALRGKQKKYGPWTYLFPNQNRPIQNQLNAGVRALMIDLHLDKNEVVLCHGGKACDLIGKDLAVKVFTNIRVFLESHPYEIVTLILESYIPTLKLTEVLNESGLSAFLHCQPKGSPWPTLGEMVAHPQSQDCKYPGRLVILNDHVEENDPKWNLNLFGDWAIETKYSYKKIEELDCELNRGDKKNDLFILNHFTTFIAGKKRDAKKINQYHFLMDRVKKCEAVTGKIANFITVDFYSSGEALAVIKQLND
jgi:hypothetical protein